MVEDTCNYLLVIWCRLSTFFSLWLKTPRLPFLNLSNNCSMNKPKNSSIRTSFLCSENTARSTWMFKTLKKKWNSSLSRSGLANVSPLTYSPKVMKSTLMKMLSSITFTSVLKIIMNTLNGKISSPKNMVSQIFLKLTPLISCLINSLMFVTPPILHTSSLRREKSDLKSVLLIKTLLPPIKTELIIVWIGKLITSLKDLLIKSFTRVKTARSPKVLSTLPTYSISSGN